MNDFYSRDEMIKAVESYLIENQFEVSIYDPTFEPARVPIFAYKSTSQPATEDKKITNEIFVDIITEKNIDSSLYFKDRNIGRILGSHEFKINDASSAQFFRHYFPSAKIYWAVPDYAVNNTNFKLFEDICKKQLVGLFIVKTDRTDNKLFVEEKLDTVPLIGERLHKIRSIFEEKTRKKYSRQFLEIHALLEDWTRDDLSYHIYYPEPIFTATDISSKVKKIGTELSDRMSELLHLSYQNILSTFSIDYRSKTGIDDNAIAQKVIEELWNIYGFPYPKLHTEYEAVLKLDPDYRDHFLHAFQVFLFGAYVIDKFYPEIKKHFKTETGAKIEDAWLIAATYHDYNYMIQRFKQWTKRFFQDALHIEGAEIDNPASLHLTETYVKNGYMFNTQVLARLIKLEMSEVTLKYLYDRILEKYNHGLLSGLSLLKYIKLKDKVSILKDNVLNSAFKAISIHDGDVWHNLCGLANNQAADTIGQNFNEKAMVRNINFDDDPISFLLILSDSIQEQGRETIGSETKIELTSLYEKDNKIFTTITFDGNKSENAFKWKMEELDKVSKFLVGNKRFEIIICDKSTNRDFKYTI